MLGYANILQKLLGRNVRFIDLFAGIGGFHLAFHQLKASCVFASEIDPAARKTYQDNLYALSPLLFDTGKFNDNILNIQDPAIEIPDFDVLCAGFPCQPFSQAGFKRGFNETRDARGNMFFEIAAIIQAKRPKAIFLENVRHILKHDEGKTFSVIQQTIRNLGYSFHFKVVKASEHNLPQHRPRVFMVGFRKDSLDLPEFHFPIPEPLKISMSDVWNGHCSREIGYTLRVGGRRSGLHDRRNWDTYLVDGDVKVLGPDEGLKMMGFPNWYKFNVSDTQAMKQLGNSVAVNAVRATGKQIIDYLKEHQQLFQAPVTRNVA